MACSIFRHTRRKISSGCAIVTFIGAAALANAMCFAANDPPPVPPQTMRQSAVPAEKSESGPKHSYEYYRAQLAQSQCQPMQSQIELGRIPTATGWYNYGFPMSPFRYGYFGAERSPYPRVMWHQGYYGDKTRTAYWQSYE